MVWVLLGRSGGTALLAQNRKQSRNRKKYVGKTKFLGTPQFGRIWVICAFGDPEAKNVKFLKKL